MQQLLNISGCHFFPGTQDHKSIFTIFSATAALADSSVVSSAGALLTAREPD